MRLLAAGLLSLLLGAAPAAVTAAAPAAAVEKTSELRLTKHARQRMAERGVSEAQVRAAVEKGESFPYYHDGRWKKGYFDESAGLFVAANGGDVITVFKGADRGYVNRLKRKKP